jgi:hypothetical protein
MRFGEMRCCTFALHFYCEPYVQRGANHSSATHLAPSVGQLSEPPEGRSRILDETAHSPPFGDGFLSVQAVSPSAVSWSRWRAAPCSVKPAHLLTAQCRGLAWLARPLGFGRAARGFPESKRRVHEVGSRFLLHPHPLAVE